MPDRLAASDVSFLYLEGRTTPMHAGGLAIFASPGDGFDYERLVELIEDRISLVPRYRQKVRFVPGHLANPVWVDDPDFDITYHVRRSALPKPGSDEQLREFCARIQSRPLDRSRPLWEMYLVEGLEGDRFAIITKSHHSMVDGVRGVDIGQVILDTSPLGTHDVRSLAGRVLEVAGSLVSAAGAMVRPAPSSPLSMPIGEQRRFGVARTSLDDYKVVRRRHGGAINDVVLATVAGALRGWPLFRGEPVTPATTVRAMVPVSVRSASDVA